MTIPPTGASDAGSSVFWFNNKWNRIVQAQPDNIGFLLTSSHLGSWSAANMKQIRDLPLPSFNNGTVMVATGDVRNILISAILSQGETNQYVPGTLKADRIQGSLAAAQPTNAALGGALINMAVRYQHTNSTAFGTMAFTGITGQSGTEATETTILITCATNKVVTIPADFKVSDTIRSITVMPTSNVWLRVLHIPGVTTNAEFKLCL